ncbi:MAG: hypothetical protein COA74_11445 [Gammaproteobacteria bacterium]|nr:MAG: hypothetical protein COA74_11445 [Gammaproteobacteria bacterium]
MNWTRLKITLILGTMLFTLSSFAQQQAIAKKSAKEVEKTTSSSTRLLGMSVTGNKESPRSLTIVPWRDPLMEGKSPEIIPVWQPNLSLLDPDAYRRDVKLFLKTRNQRQTLQNAN